MFIKLEGSLKFFYSINTLVKQGEVTPAQTKYNLIPISLNMIPVLKQPTTPQCGAVSNMTSKMSRSFKYLSSIHQPAFHADKVADRVEQSCWNSFSMRPDLVSAEGTKNKDQLCRNSQRSVCFVTMSLFLTNILHMTGCLNINVCTPNCFWPDARQPSGLDLNHLDEREGLAALCCWREWFTGQKKKKKRKKIFPSSAKTLK